MSNITNLSHGNGKPIRVLIVDDHAMVREGLRCLLEEYPNIEVVGEAANGEEGVMLAQNLQPSVIIMDINMPGMNGIEATVRIKAQNRELPIVGLSVNDAQLGHAILRAGATLFVAKESAGERLYMAILEAVNASDLQAQ